MFIISLINKNRPCPKIKKRTYFLIMFKSIIVLASLLVSSTWVKAEGVNVYCLVYFKENPGKKYLLNGSVLKSIKKDSDNMILINGYLEESIDYQDLDIYNVKERACTHDKNEALAILQESRGNSGNTKNDASSVESVAEVNKTAKTSESESSSENPYVQYKNNNKTEDKINTEKNVVKFIPDVKTIEIAENSGKDQPDSVFKKKPLKKTGSDKKKESEKRVSSKSNGCLSDHELKKLKDDSFMKEIFSFGFLNKRSQYEIENCQRKK